MSSCSHIVMAFNNKTFEKSWTQDNTMSHLVWTAVITNTSSNSTSIIQAQLLI